MRSLRRGVFVSLFSGVLGGGCGGASSSDTGVCDPGVTQVCLGPGACEGAQVCSDDGSRWGPCDCGGNAGAAGSDVGGSAGRADGGADGGTSGVDGGTGGADGGTGGVDGGTGGASGAGGGVGGADDGPWPDGHDCTDNGQCDNTCIRGVCAPQSGLDEDCDDTADCATNTSCDGTSCVRNITRLTLDNLGSSCGDISASMWATTDADGNRQQLVSAVPCSAFLSGMSIGTGDYFALEGAYSDTAQRWFTLQAFALDGSLVDELLLEDCSLEQLMFDHSRSNPVTVFRYEGATGITARAFDFVP